MRKKNSILFRIGNTLVNNSFYIIWSLLLPLMTIFAGQGTELLDYILLEKESTQLILVIISIILLGYALWIIPVNFFGLYNWVLKLGLDKKKIFRAVTAERVRTEYSSLPLSFLSILPLLVFVSVLGAPQTLISGWKGWLLYWLCIFTFVYLLSKIYKHIYKVQKSILQYSTYLFWRTGIPKLIMAIESFFRNRLNSVEGEMNLGGELYEKAWAFNWINWLYKALFILVFYVSNPFFFSHRWALVTLLSILCLWLFGVLKCIERQDYLGKTAAVYREDKNKRTADYWMMRVNYFVLFVLVLAFVIRFYMLSNADRIGDISSLIIIGFFFTLLLMLFDIFYKTPLALISIYSRKIPKSNVFGAQHLTEERKRFRLNTVRILLVLLSLGFWSLVILYNPNKHRIRKHTVKKEDYLPSSKRLGLLEYFEKWYDVRNRPKKVLLFSGQGGGSRAAAWIHLALNEMDKDGKLLDHVFAISTASGSTVGINMKFAQWKLSRFGNQFIRDSNRNDIINLYKQNYFSNSFYGLLFGDLVESIIKREKHFDVDRNYRLQKEELKGFIETFKPKSKLDSQIVVNHFEKDFLYMYYGHSKIEEESYPYPPLFFINSTLVQNAHRAVIAPVVLDSMPAIDVLDRFKRVDSQNFYALPMVTAVNQSQAFPIISSQNFIEGFGNLADGGFVENSGCGFVHSVYKRLKKRYKDTIEFVIIDFQNSGNRSDSLYSLKTDSVENINASTSVLYSVLYNTGVVAYSDFWRYQLINEVRSHKQDTFLSIWLDKEITLSRVLTSTSIMAMYDDLERLNSTALHFVDTTFYPKIKN